MKIANPSYITRSGPSLAGEPSLRSLASLAGSPVAACESLSKAVRDLLDYESSDMFWYIVATEDDWAATNRGSCPPSLALLALGVLFGEVVPDDADGCCPSECSVGSVVIRSG
jgi:hypothetical protein